MSCLRGENIIIYSNILFVNRAAMGRVWFLLCMGFITQAVRPGFKFRLSFFFAFSHKLPSGL